MLPFLFSSQTRVLYTAKIRIILFILDMTKLFSKTILLVPKQVWHININLPTYYVLLKKRYFSCCIY